MKTRHVVLTIVVVAVPLAVIVGSPTEVLRHCSHQKTPCPNAQGAISGDLSAALGTIAPQVRLAKAFSTIDQLDRLAGTPLGSSAEIMITGDRALVFPVAKAAKPQTWLHNVLGSPPSGRGKDVTFLNVNSEWFFTGNHHVV